MTPPRHVGKPPHSPAMGSRAISSVFVFAAGVLAVASGCAGSPTSPEQRAREDVETVRAAYRPGDATPALPALTSESPLADTLRFAVLRHRSVEAAYYAWVASVERITVARSRPDPRLTFEADVSRMLGALMPGLMVDFPGPGKLAAAGEVAAEESRATYFAFEQAILRTAVAVKTAYYRLHFLEENLRVQRATLALLRDLERLAQQQNAAGRGTLQDVLRAQIELEQVTTQIENLTDSRLPLLAELKAAVGLGVADADPAIPAAFEPSPDTLDADELLRTALVRNPGLRRMESEVRRGEAMIGLARKTAVPDYALGLEADVKAVPVMWRPGASVTLPIWRDKIAAEIASAQAEKRSAEARLGAEQIAVATELAMLLYAYRESRRDIELLSERLIPKGRQSLEAARIGYSTARAGFLDVLDAQRQLLAFESSLVDARTRRELALASISFTLAGVPPAGAPVLPAASAPEESKP